MILGAGEIQSCKFVDIGWYNRSGNMIYAIGLDTLVINQSYFSNFLVGTGSVLTVASTNLVLINSSFINNTQNMSGAAIVISSNTNSQTGIGTLINNITVNGTGKLVSHLSFDSNDFYIAIINSTFFGSNSQSSMSFSSCKQIYMYNITVYDEETPYKFDYYSLPTQKIYISK